MSARDFKRRRMALLDALVGHPDQPPNVFRLFYLITGYVNAATGDAWPSQERLARELGLTVRTVRDRTDWLVDNGYLEVTAGRGRSITHRYRMPEPTRQSDLWEDATIVPPPIKAAAAKRKPAPALRPSDNSFETFWQAYPRKIDKAAAQRTFQSIRRPERPPLPNSSMARSAMRRNGRARTRNTPSTPRPGSTLAHGKTSRKT